MFAVLSVIWTGLLYVYKNKILPVHHMVTVVLYACLFESMFTLMFYSYENKKIGDYALFWFFISIMEVVRSVFSRVIVLLTALGQHITTHSVGSNYHMNIGIVSFLYTISLMIAILIQHLKDQYQISAPTVFALELPNHLMNIIIFLWITLAFRKTLVTLNQNQQYQKSQIVMQMFLVYLASLLAITAIFIYAQVGRGHPDKHWDTLASHMSSYFIVFIFFTTSYTFILRPSNAKIYETFNQYQDLSNEDNQDENSRPQFMPESAANYTTEMQDYSDPLDKKEMDRQAALQRENDEWKRNKPKKWEY